MVSLGKTFVAGVIWGTIEKFASLFIGFVITVLLARKLTPADYGLVNMIHIFTVFGMVLIDGGFGQALIQKRDVSNKDYSTIFFLNILLSLAVFVALYYSAPFIAEFYRQPSLISISRTLFLLFPINAFSIIQHTLLTKQLKVKQLTLVSVVSSLISGFVGLYYAYSGYGVWALVYQTLALYIVRTFTLWIINDWRPIVVFSISSIKAIWNFSINLLGTFTLASIFQNIYTVIIGRFFNVVDVGFYNQAFRFESLATSTVTSAVQRVSFPAFSELQNDMDRLRSAYKKVINVTMYLHLPIMLGIATIGHDLFLVLLTEKWLPSVPSFHLLCITSSLYPMHMINVNVIKALGKGRLYFRLNLLKYLLMTIFIILTIRHSIIAVLLGYVIATISSCLFITYYCGKEIKYSIYSQFKGLIPIFITTGVMICLVLSCRLMDIQPAIRLFVEILVGIASYVGLSYIFKLEVFTHLVNIVKKQS